ncbi:AIPR family protein [Hoeflea sp.]|uniref:AIPR family protein n=1 Tax=Hoeflea sp. TaxID=1940281 RepID=UPI003749F8F1
MDSVTRALMEEFSSANGMNDLSEDKKFEHFVTHCIVSSRYKDEFDTADLVAGDGADLNVDGFSVKVNGRIANDAEFVDDVLDMNGYLDVEFIIIQAKTTSKFDGAAMIALGDNLAKQVFADKQTMPANDDIKRLVEIKESIFRNATKLKENPVCRLYYACTGNWNDDLYLVEAIKQKRKDLLDTNLFSNVYYEPLGARELQKMFRDTKTSISKEVNFEKLVTLPSIEGVAASYLGVLPHLEFLKLISDESGDLIKSVFIDNFRDFQGDNPVNIDIAKTITDGMFDQFALRNNGVTIVAKNVKVTSSKFTLEDYQIVNGCQTSHVLYSNRNSISGELFVPIKLIHTENEDVSQSVIKSTNKQTPVEENDLLALTQFQRDLEDYYAGIPKDYQLY